MMLPAIPQVIEQRSAEAGQQLGLPLGYVLGQAVTEHPKDLYIPEDALKVVLESFSGPMDLLLYLIQRERVHIIDLPILPITEQYMAYIGLMDELKLELAADYLVMAAMLTEIKSRLLLPRTREQEEEDDPRAELLRRLQEYELFKHTALQLNELPRNERDFYLATAVLESPMRPIRSSPDVTLTELSLAFSSVMKRVNAFEHHQIKREKQSTQERMSQLIEHLSDGRIFEFSELFQAKEGKTGALVTFLALLELNKEQRIELSQDQLLAPIYVRKKAQSHG